MDYEIIESQDSRKARVEVIRIIGRYGVQENACLQRSRTAFQGHRGRRCKCQQSCKVLTTGAYG